jgi:hypothetical protein
VNGEGRGVLVSASIPRKEKKYFVPSAISRMLIIRRENDEITAVCPVTMATANTKYS